jgi:hypothetical protein
MGNSKLVFQSPIVLAIFYASQELQSVNGKHYIER